MFYTEFIIAYRCECGQDLFSFQILIDIPLLLPSEIIETNLNDLLDKFFEKEKIQFEYKCTNCLKVTSHEKVLKISKMPKILIISLQRMDHVNKIKNEIFVNFEDTLNISKYVDNDCENNINFEYKLYATINHHGEFEFGHYYSIIKLFSQKFWYEFNDSNVYQLESTLKKFENSYVLFYIKN